MERSPSSIALACVRGAPLYLAVAGLLLTTLVAFLQQSNEERERELLFESEAARIERTIIDGLDRHAAEFESTINFTAATHPGPLDEFRSYFEREVGLSQEADPGVLLVERVPPGGADELVARELALGHDDFAIRGFQGLPGERFVITRTVQDVDVLGIPLRGLDVTSIQSMLVQATIPESGFALSVVESDSLVSLLSVDPRVTSDDPRFGDVTAILIGAVHDDDGELLGYVTRFMAVDELFASLDELMLQSMNIELRIEGIESPAVTLTDEDAETKLTDATLSTTTKGRSAELGWSLRVWGEDDFGTHLGLVEQSNVWGIGIPVTVMVFLTIVGRSYHRRRIDQAEFELEHVRALASTDALTGLLNRQGLIDSARGVDDNLAASIFFVDLDGFKIVNDLEGHEAGDQVLREVSRRLREIFRPQDFVCRLGGDEFVIFTPGASDGDYQARISQRITVALAQVDERVTSSVGVASRLAGSGTDVKELLRNADGAMYEAKRSGGDCFVVSGS